MYGQLRSRSILWNRVRNIKEVRRVPLNLYVKTQRELYDNSTTSVFSPTKTIMLLNLLHISPPYFNQI